MAEDLTSEVFLKLLQVLGTSRAPREQLQGWLYRVARNLAVDWFRQQAKGAALSLDEKRIPGGDSPATRLEERELQRDLREAISKLAPSQQQVIVLRFGEGLKIREVSDLMGKSEGAVKLIQYRAMKNLRALLERQGKKGGASQQGTRRDTVPTKGGAGQDRVPEGQVTAALKRNLRSGFLARPVRHSLPQGSNHQKSPSPETRQDLLPER